MNLRTIRQNAISKIYAIQDHTKLSRVFPNYEQAFAKAIRDFEAKAGHSGRVEVRKTPEKPGKYLDRGPKIIAALQSHGGKMTQQDLIRVTGIPYRAVSQITCQFEKKGVLKKTRLSHGVMMALTGVAA